MSAKSFALPIRVGVVAGEPIRLEGLTSVFEREPEFGQSPLLPVIGTLDELMAKLDLEYLVIDLNASARGLQSIPEIRRQRPALRLIVIGPAGNSAAGSACTGVGAGRWSRRSGGGSDRSLRCDPRGDGFW